MSWREALADWLFGDIIAARLRAASVTVRVDDSPGWTAHGSAPGDRPWSELLEDIEDALEAWRKNFLVRRIVNLVRSYVVGGGITLSSEDQRVEKFLQAFWTHPQNHVATRLGPMCDELTRSGELFPVLFTNPVDGMSYLRFVPASQLREIRTDPHDYEHELSYVQSRSDGSEKVWAGMNLPGARRAGVPVMLHLAVNRPIGATRGEGDLTPILPWARRYSEWLKDRVRLNRIRTRQGVLDVTVSDDSMVDEKRQQLRTQNPLESGIYVHGTGETVALHALNLDAKDAKEDGRTLRLAVATGANIAMHYLSEGEGTNYATAKEMGEPTARFFTDRQQEFCAGLVAIAEAAYRRAVWAGRADLPHRGLRIVARTTEVAREDNQALAAATREIVTALSEMRARGWVDDETAVTMAFKFAGETLEQGEIARILEKTHEEPAAPPSVQQGAP